MFKKYIISLTVLLALVSAQVKDESPTKTLEEFLAGISKTPDSIAALKDAIYNGNDEIKSKSIEALANMGADEAKSIFKEYISYGTQKKQVNKDISMDASWLVRSHCAMGIAKLKDKSAGKTLRRALSIEKNDVVIKTIIYALGEIEDIESVKPIIQMMEIAGEDAMVIECVQALGKIGDKKCFLPLLTVSTGKYLPVTKKEAIKALEKIKW